MKKLLILPVLLFSLFTASAQSSTSDADLGKGSYRLLKFDALNMMGLGIQKLHLAYEVSPMKANENNLPTIQFNVIVPFNSLNECALVNYGTEVGIDLRFYQRTRRGSLGAEGFFMGVGMDGGYVNFDRTETYYSRTGANPVELNTNYDRMRTGIYFQFGAQTKLGEKLYFDANVGLGWSNVNVQERNNPVVDPDLILEHNYCGVFYILYQEGRYQQFYMPVSFNLGYNFGSK